jgi:hypothetical protein
LQHFSVCKSANADATVRRTVAYLRAIFHSKKVSRRDAEKLNQMKTGYGGTRKIGKIGLFGLFVQTVDFVISKNFL